MQNLKSEVNNFIDKINVDKSALSKMSLADLFSLLHSLVDSIIKGLPANTSTTALIILNTILNLLAALTKLFG